VGTPSRHELTREHITKALGISSKEWNHILVRCLPLALRDGPLHGSHVQVNVRLIYAQAGLETPPGGKSVSWSKKSYEKRGRAVVLLRRRHPVLARAEGDWAASWFFRRRTKTHNRTLRERKKKRKHPLDWARKEARRKYSRYNKLHDEVQDGDLGAVQEALYQKAIRDNQGA
jgi:hypothetical protein